MDLCNINDIKSLLSRHGFHFSKRMGQNFLIEGWVPREIAAASGADRSCGVLEIGPGIGPLTAELAQYAGRVVSVELDRSLLPVLAETMSEYENVEIVSGDIMKLDIPEFISDKLSYSTVIACANLPYNITTPVLAAMIEASCFASITVMIQREVARRICAAPATADYGAFSVYCQYYTAPELLFDVPPECFLPAPKVTSSVIRLVPRPAPPVPVKNERLFFQVVKASFAQRRKTLLNSLASAFGSRITKDILRQIIADCSFPADIRGERLGISEFAMLTDRLDPRL